MKPSNSAQVPHPRAGLFRDMTIHLYKAWLKMKHGARFLILILLMMVYSTQAWALPEKIYKSLDLFTKALYIVEKDYVEEVDGEDLVYGAIKGMMGTLDPYSIFMTPDVYKDLKVDTVGRFGGVGLEITLQGGILTVVSPIEDTPAARAGIQPGDKILKIDGKTTKGMNLVDAVRRMRGIKKSKVTLSIFRKGIKKPFDVSLERDVIKVKSVKAEILPGNIALLRLTSFQENTTRELKEILSKLTKENQGKAFSGIILDLRYNPGGLLEEAVTVSDMFLSKGTIVSTKGRTGLLDVRKAEPGEDQKKVPIVVLINKGSASASEIVAAALRDNKRAKIIGTQSFGKGSVQTVIDLGEDTGLKLTVAKYYTPSGESINGTGVKPDFIIENPEDKKSELRPDPKNDLQRQAAIQYLKTGRVSVKPAKKSDLEDSSTTSDLDQEADLHH